MATRAGWLPVRSIERCVVQRMRSTKRNLFVATKRSWHRLDVLRDFYDSLARQGVELSGWLVNRIGDIAPLGRCAEMPDRSRMRHAGDRSTTVPEALQT
jgi:hypothetical protein